MPSRFFIEPSVTIPGLSGLGNVIKESLEKRETQRKQDAAQEEIQTAMASGDNEAIARLSIKYPQLRESIKDFLGVVEERQEKEAGSFMASVLANPEGAAEQYERRIQDLEGQGRDATQTRESYQDYLENPEAELQEMRMLYAGISPEGYKVLGGPEKKIGISPASPKDFTVDSLAQYEASGKIGDLVRYRPEIKEIAGVQHQYNPERLMWEPLVDMGSSELAQQVKATTALEAEKQSKLDFTKAQSKFRDKESKLISSIGSGESKNEILLKTATQMKSLASGWSTEYGASLASLPATEARKMKGLINTIRANSAFTTLVDLKESGGTLGAISEAELVLLESAMGSLDQAGTIEELNRVLDQILRANQSAMQRVKNAYQMDKKKYGTSFEEATTEISDDEILGKYL